MYRCIVESFSHLFVTCEVTSSKGLTSLLVLSIDFRSLLELLISFGDMSMTMGELGMT